MLKTRIATALALLTVFVPVTLWAPPRIFAASIAFVLVCAAWEWARLLRLRDGWAAGYACAAAVVLLATLSGGPAAASGLIAAAAVFWLGAAPFALLRKPALAGGAWRIFLLVAGWLLLAACWHALQRARALGVSFVISLLLVVWLADIGAYFAGKAFGRHKLAPAISPGKTWEGALGGWIAVLVVSTVAVLAHAFEPTLYSALFGRGAAAALGALTVLVAFSIVGDLFESTMKRQAGVKDSSGLLPGHGGVLDRIDALLPVLPLAMLALSLFG